MLQLRRKFFVVPSYGTLSAPSDGAWPLTLNIELDEQQIVRLQAIASRLNVSVGDLAKAAINDLLAKPESEFEQAAARVLKKNAELYRRLA